MNVLAVVVLNVFALAACGGPPPASTPRVAPDGDVVTPDGVHLHYQLRGTGRYTIVVVHGGPGLSSSYIAPDLDELAQRYTVISYDQRGCGQSTVVADPARLRLEDLVAACKEFWALFIRGYLADPATLTRMKGDVCAIPVDALRNRAQVAKAALGESWDWREEFHQLHVPVLVIAGDKSPIPNEASAEWKTAFPSAQMVTITGAGHFPYVEQPAAFLAAVDSFVQSGTSQR